jgi:hypothetical protein
MPNHSPSIHFARQVSYDNLINQLEIEKARLLEFRKTLSDRELAIAKTLQDKYGEGSINLETGEVNS